MQGYGNLNVFDPVVRDNRSWAGGGINSGSGRLDIRRSEIIGNVVESQPGNGAHGAGFQKGNGDGSLLVADTLVAGNSSVGGNAGGMYTNGLVMLLSSRRALGRRLEDHLDAHRAR